MATIVTRAGKGSKLTHNEVDANFENLNNAKLENTQWAADNTIVIRDKDGSLTHIVVGEQTLLGRITGGNIVALTPTQIKTLLSLVIADISGLQAALDAKLSLSVFSANNTIVIKNNAGTIDDVGIDEQRLVGRITGGEITGLTAVQVKALLAIAIGDVSGLQAALDAKAPVSYFSGYQLVAVGTDTLAGGVKNVAFAGFTAGDLVEAFPQNGGANTGILFKSGEDVGIGFQISSSNPADTCTFLYKVWRAIP